MGLLRRFSWLPKLKKAVLDQGDKATCQTLALSTAIEYAHIIQKKSPIRIDVEDLIKKGQVFGVLKKNFNEKSFLNPVQAAAFITRHGVKLMDGSYRHLKFLELDENDKRPITPFEIMGVITNQPVVIGVDSGVLFGGEKGSLSIEVLKIYNK